MSAESTLSSVEKQITAELGKKWKWSFITGFLILLLGIYSVSMPISSTANLTYAIATLLSVSGALLLFQSFRLIHEHGSFTRFIHSIVSIVTGGLMFRYPDMGMLGIAMALAFYFFVASSVQCIFALTIRPARVWLVEMVNSLISLTLGICIIFTFPMSAVWVPGFVLGVGLISRGVSMISFSLGARNMYTTYQAFNKIEHSNQNSSLHRPKSVHS